jgi:hypothetical protein
MEFEIIIRETNFGLYDDLYKKFLLVKIENIDSKVQTGEKMKVKGSFCSLDVENCNDSFKSRDLRTIVFIGATQMPKSKHAHEKIVQGALDDSQSQLTMTFTDISDSRSGSLVSESSISSLNSSIHGDLGVIREVPAEAKFGQVYNPEQNQQSRANFMKKPDPDNYNLA